MAAAFQLPSLQGPPQHKKSQFLGQTKLFNSPHKSAVTIFKLPSSSSLSVSAKLNLYEILGGRGLCNGEEGLQEELKKTVSQEEASPVTTTDEEGKQAASTVSSVPEDGFEKELLGLTGGFPGGEKGLKKFIEQNPPPPPPPPKKAQETVGFNQSLVKKPKPPELPLLLPGMIAIVKNQNSPYYMYCGIVQRITDGKAGVLFEGGNWDRLISFRLEELECREKGPPMVNPKSVVLEEMQENRS